MKILALPGPASDFYPVRSKELFQAPHSRLPLIGFVDQTSEVIADKLVHGCVAVEGDFSSGP
jgi:hypothetical protein